MTTPALHTPPDPREGRVVQEHLGRYVVASGEARVSCSVSSKLRKTLEYPTADPSSLRQRVIAVRGIRSVSPVSLGDFVSYGDAGEGAGMIYRVLDRRNKLSRRAPGGRPLEQILIANLDLAVLVFSLQEPPLNREMLDRFLALSELEEIPPLVCLNKLDLSEAAEGRLLASVYERIGYRVLPISARTGTGVEDVRAELRGKVAVFLGPSGAGKTTLLNALHPGLGHRVGEVSRATGHGRHTTTRSELIPTGDDGWIGDTPGLRELGFWHVDPDQLYRLFAEMRRLAGTCRFRNCIHAEEPGCAVKAAVEAGEIDPGRYRSYLSIRGRP